MKSHKVEFYFVLYMIAVVSGFTAISDRDELETETRSVLLALKQFYTTDPKIITESISIDAGSKLDTTVIFQQIGMMSDEEKMKTKYEYTTTLSAVVGDAPIVTTPDGHGRMRVKYNPTKITEGTITVTMKLRRIVDSTLATAIKDSVNLAILDSPNKGYVEVRKTIPIKWTRAGRGNEGPDQTTKHELPELSAAESQTKEYIP